MSELSDEDLRVIHWAILVATDAVTLSAGDGKISKEDATKMLFRFGEIDDKLVKLLTETELT